MNTTRRRAFSEGAEAPPVAESPAPVDGATEKQLAFIRSLMEQKKISESQREAANERLASGNLSKSQASLWIEKLLDYEDKPRTAVELPDVPAGRYAITGDDGTTDFYKVDRPEKGRWAGYTFVKLILGGGGEQRQSFENTRTILERIVVDGPREAAIRYGMELGECSICGRTLTNPESIAAGIGPVCAGKRGWWSE